MYQSRYYHFDYYTNYIKSREDWNFVEVYTDEGITGTNTKRREGFKRMVTDALAGKIDLIVTKSVSRFARNTVDSLTTIRKLKEKGCECFFEKENIWTFDSKGELLITIMSSLAQEESRSISENCTWGQRKRFADGKVTVPFKRFIGYDRGPNGELVVNPEQAKTVQRIYAMYLKGMTPHRIAKTLTDGGILSPGGKKQWNQSSVVSLLTNEKYKGDALLQKSFTVNFLTKEKKVNEGEIPQYYVEGDHEAIIDREVWDMVQREMERRKKSGARYSGVELFSSTVLCGLCGGTYGSKVWHSNSKYRQSIWQCNRKYKKKNSHCDSPHLTDQEIKDAVISATNKLIQNREEIISAFKRLTRTIFDTKPLEAQFTKSQAELTVTATLIEEAVRANARTVQDQEVYQQNYDALESRFEEEQKRLETAQTKLNEINAAKDSIQSFLKSLSAQENLLTEFDEQLFCALVDHLTVFSRDEIRVTFRDGTEITA